jgi:hypothetical protein
MRFSNYFEEVILFERLGCFYILVIRQIDVIGLFL